MSIYIAPRAKAVNGPGAATMTTNPPLAAGLFINSVPMMMRAYWQTAHRNPWINAAESLISGKVAGVPWHLEVGEDEVTGQESPFTAALLRLFENPQGNLPLGRKMTRREFWNLTSRFLGLTGNAFWLLDERNVFGLPNSMISIRPDRMTPAEDARGNLTGWVLDQQGATVNGAPLNGIALELGQVLQFTLTPPEEGHFGMGKVEAALRKAQLTELADSYAAGTLASGGRLSGFVTGTTNAPIPDEQFKQLVRDLRSVTEAPDAARRTTVLQGPVDWKPTGITPLDMALVDLMKLTRDDIFGIWGAPFSLVYGGNVSTGLNSGDSRKYDEAALWQGPVHERLVAITEVIQYQFLDRVVGGAQLEIEEPEFDDDSPRYDLLGKSVDIALTDDERRELIGKDPLPNGKGLTVRLPLNIVEAFIVPPEPVETSSTEAALGVEPLGKATGLERSLTTLRAAIDRTQTPRIREAVAKFLDRQKAEITRKVREHAEHIASKPKDTSPWWDAEKWDKALQAVLRPYLEAVAGNVTAHIESALPAPGKADPVAIVLTRGAARVTKINQTTRDGLQDIIAAGIEAGLSPAALGDNIEAWTGFDEYRSELIGRTELMDAYNAAALGTYSEAGITMVEAIDGDGDQECIDRVAGNPYTIEEASSIEDHPNGTLDWVPVIGEPEPAKAGAAPVVAAAPVAEPGPRMAHAMELFLAERERQIDERRLEAEDRAAKASVEAAALDDRLMALTEQYATLAHAEITRVPTPITVNVPEQAPPVVNVHVDAPVVNVPEKAVTVNIPPGPKRVVKTVVRNEAKEIVGSIEERE